MTTIATATPSLELYRTAHKIEPVLAPNGHQVCATDGIPVYTVVSPRWQHDPEAIRRLIRDETARLVYEPCFFCGSVDLVVRGLYTRVTLGAGAVNLCSDCFEKGDES